MEQWNLVQKWATLAGVVTTDKEIMHGNCMSHSGAGLHPAGRFFNRPSCTEQPASKSAYKNGAALAKLPHKLSRIPRPQEVRDSA
jgi:hypothetical protein